MGSEYQNQTKEQKNKKIQKKYEIEINNLILEHNTKPKTNWDSFIDSQLLMKFKNSISEINKEEIIKKIENNKRIQKTKICTLIQTLDPTVEKITTILNEISYPSAKMSNLGSNYDQETTTLDSNYDQETTTIENSDFNTGIKNYNKNIKNYNIIPSTFESLNSTIKSEFENNLEKKSLLKNKNIKDFESKMAANIITLGAIAECEDNKSSANEKNNSIKKKEDLKTPEPSLGHYKKLLSLEIINVLDMEILNIFTNNQANNFEKMIHAFKNIIYHLFKNEEIFSKKNNNLPVEANSVFNWMNYYIIRICLILNNSLIKTNNLMEDIDKIHELNFLSFYIHNLFKLNQVFDLSQLGQQDNYKKIHSTLVFINNNNKENKQNQPATILEKLIDKIHELKFCTLHIHNLFTLSQIKLKQKNDNSLLMELIELFCNKTPVKSSVKKIIYSIDFQYLKFMPEPSLTAHLFDLKHLDLNRSERKNKSRSLELTNFDKERNKSKRENKSGPFKLTNIKYDINLQGENYIKGKLPKVTFEINTNTPTSKYEIPENKNKIEIPGNNIQKIKICRIYNFNKKNIYDHGIEYILHHILKHTPEKLDSIKNLSKENPLYGIWNGLSIFNNSVLNKDNKEYANIIKILKKNFNKTCIINYQLSTNYESDDNKISIIYAFGLK